MIIALDVGNTNIVIGGIASETVLFTGRMTTGVPRTADEYAVLIKEILSVHQVDLAGVEGAVISSVVPAVTDLLGVAMELLTGQHPLVVGRGAETGLKNKTDHPSRSGSDLIADCVAATKRYPLPLVVIDMGTATTLSTVDRNGHYIGNIIFPGVALSVEMLSGKTAQLPAVELEAPQRVVATNTEESIRSGLILGNASMLDGMLDRIESELGEPVHAVATGGLAQRVIPHCRREIAYNPHLLLLGLADIFERNRK